MDQQATLQKENKIIDTEKCENINTMYVNKIKYTMYLC